MVRFSLKNLMLFVTLIAVVSGFSKLLFECDVVVAAISVAILPIIFIHAVNRNLVVSGLFSYTLYIASIVRLNYELWRIIDQWLQS